MLGARLQAGDAAVCGPPLVSSGRSRPLALQMCQDGPGACEERSPGPARVLMPWGSGPRARSASWAPALLRGH